MSELKNASNALRLTQDMIAALAAETARAAGAPTSLVSITFDMLGLKQRTFNSPQPLGEHGANSKSKVALENFESKASLDLKCDMAPDPSGGSHLRSDALGAPAKTRVEIVRATKSLVFSAGEMRDGEDRPLMAATAVHKILR